MSGQLWYAGGRPANELVHGKQWCRSCARGGRGGAPGPASSSGGRCRVRCGCVARSGLFAVVRASPRTSRGRSTPGGRPADPDFGAVDEPGLPVGTEVVDDLGQGPQPHPRPRPGRKLDLVPFVPQGAQLCDEFSDHVGRQARDPTVADDRGTRRVPHHTTMIDDQKLDASPLTVHKRLTPTAGHHRRDRLPTLAAIRELHMITTNARKVLSAPHTYDEIRRFPAPDEARVCCIRQRSHPLRVRAGGRRDRVPRGRWRRGCRDPSSGAAARGSLCLPFRACESTRASRRAGRISCVCRPAGRRRW